MHGSRGLCALSLDELHALTTLLQGSSLSSTHGTGSSMGLKAMNAGIGEKISPAMNWTSVMNPVILSY